MLRRHGERYPLAGQGAGFVKVLDKIEKSNGGKWVGDLEFLNRWDFYVPDLGYLELESKTGPYSGLLGTYRQGTEYRIRYGHLWNEKKNKTVPVWAGESHRVVQTARSFGRFQFLHSSPSR